MTAESNLKNAAEALSESEEISVLTAGISMRPMLREHKDIAVIRRKSGRLKRNDVPLYSRPGSEKFILHRILKVTPNGYVIRGDNLFKKEYDQGRKYRRGVKGVLPRRKVYRLRKKPRL